MSVTVHCPICGAEIECTVDAGEPAHGPTYSCGGYPGSAPFLDDFEAECECYESPLVKVDKYRDEVELRALNEWGTL
jgi:hypothetical protein